MKKYKILLLALVFVMTLSGCVRFNTTITIKKDGKADISMTYAIMSMEGSGFGEGSGSSFDKSMDDMRQQGWQVEKYKQDGYEGVYAIKKDIDLTSLSDEISKAEDDMEIDNKAISLTKDGSTYIFDWKFEGETASETKQIGDAIKEYDGYMTLTVNLPRKAKTSNATKVSNGGKTLEWDLMDLGESNGIHIEFSTFNPLIIVCIAAAVILAVIAFVVVKKRR